MDSYDLKQSREEVKENVFRNMIDDRKFIPLWPNIIFLSLIHIGSIYGLYLACTSAHCYTLIFNCICSGLGSFGITAGLHRLWTHRAYKARLPLRILLLFLSTLVYQGNVIHWARDHRAHHKNTDTPADPHNARYGFVYAHMGWLIRKRSPIVKMEGLKIDLSDLYNDPVLQFQEKYKVTFVPAVSLALPTFIPMYFWGESFCTAFFVNVLRYTITLHCTALINSLAHYIGGRPFDHQIMARDNEFLSFLTSGEGFHNYHHVFPWDYKAAELGDYILNPSATFIELFAKIGWAYDLKTTSPEMVKKRCARTGYVQNIWGWGDKDQQQIDTEGVIIKNKAM